MASVAARGLNHIVSKYAQGHGELAFREMLGGAMRVKIAIAASVILLATANSRAENNKACILKATATVPRISGLVIKKTRTRPVPAAILGNLARPDPTDHRGCGYFRSGRRRNLFVYVCDDEGVGARAQGDELVSRLPTGEAALRRGRLS
jgi:hypothetical protein